MNLLQEEKSYTVCSQLHGGKLYSLCRELPRTYSRLVLPSEEELQDELERRQILWIEEQGGEA